MRDSKQNKLIEQLNFFNEEYIIENNKIIIKTNKPLYVYVTFDDNSCKIEGKFMELNFLTGTLKVNFKSLYTYTAMLPIFASLLMLFLLSIYYWKDTSIDLNHLAFLTGGFVIIFSWTIISFIRIGLAYHNTKTQIINWLS